MYLLSIVLTLLACSDKSSDSAGDSVTTATDDTSSTDSPTPTDSDPGTTDSDPGTTPTTLEIIGSYMDNWGSDHQVTETTWTSYGGSSVYHISGYDNAGDFLIAQNDAANAYFPELWSRYDWTTDAGGKLWYCSTAYDAASEADALATPRADSSAPGTSGCGGFSWTELIAM